MVRRHARSPRGPFAVDLMDGATNGGRFRSYVTETLGPAPKAGDTVILDNLPRHKVSGVRDTIERVGARLFYLPPPLATHQASFGLAPARSALQSRLQSYRAALRQAESPAALGRSAHRNGSLGYDPQGFHTLLLNRVSKLPRRLRQPYQAALRRAESSAARPTLTPCADLWATIRKAFTRFSSAECGNVDVASAKPSAMPLAKAI